MRIFISLLFLFVTTSSFAATFEGKFLQGSFILGKTEPGREVFVDKQKVHDQDSQLTQNLITEVDTRVVQVLSQRLELLPCSGRFCFLLLLGSFLMFFRGLPGYTAICLDRSELFLVYQGV